MTFRRLLVELYPMGRIGSIAAANCIHFALDSGETACYNNIDDAARQSANK